LRSKVLADKNVGFQDASRQRVENNTSTALTRPTLQYFLITAQFTTIFFHYFNQRPR
jgi:hypothetical protein